MPFAYLAVLAMIASTAASRRNTGAPGVPPRSSVSGTLNSSRRKARWRNSRDNAVHSLPSWVDALPLE
ncbi:hypothetical protein GCM10010295_04790 [Streptomyces intermedius]